MERYAFLRACLTFISLSEIGHFRLVCILYIPPDVTLISKLAKSLEYALAQVSKAGEYMPAEWKLL